MLINEKIDKLCIEKEFSGVISIFKGTKTIYNNAFGFRDIANKIDNNINTRFGIASGTKTFTALGIIKLIEKSIIDYSTTVYDIFKEEFSFIHSTATIKNLLCHTSGIYDYYDEEIIEDFDNFELDIPSYKLETPKDYYPFFRDKKYKFIPDKRFSYSNGGYIFLGIIIEKLTEMKYRDFITKFILKPIGLKKSGFYAFNNLPENTAFGYSKENNNFVTNIYNLPIYGGSDGGIYSNTFDMNRFWNMLFSYKIINKENLEKMIFQETNFQKNSGYGMGIYLSEINGEKYYSAIGSDCGVEFRSIFIPRKKITINFFSNISNGEKGIVKYILNEMKL